MKKKTTRPVVPPKAKRMVHEYEVDGYHIVPSRDKCLICMVKAGVKPIYILSYTSQGKVHPLAGVSLMNREART